MSQTNDRPLSPKVRALMQNEQREKHWNLSFEEVNDDDVEQFVDHLKKDAHCEVLSLQDNSLTRDSARDLAEMLKVNTTLKKVYLGKNFLGYDGVRYLAEMLKVNKTLRKLHLDQTGITDESARPIFEVLTEYNTSITSLNISGNYITDKSVETIIEMIQMNKTLEELIMPFNEISPENKQKILNAAQERTPPLKVDITLPTDERAKTFDKLRSDEESANLLVMQGDQSAAFGQYDEAKENYTKALKLRQEILSLYKQTFSNNNTKQDNEYYCEENKYIKAITDIKEKLNNFEKASSS